MASPLLCVSRLFLPTTITGEVPAAPQTTGLLLCCQSCTFHTLHSTPLRSALFKTAWNSHALEASLNAGELLE